MHRSVAHSAGAALIILGAVLTSAAPVAAQTAPGADLHDGKASSCQTSRTERQGLDDIVWSLLLGPQSATTVETRCEDAVTVQQDAVTTQPDGARGVLGPVLGP
ncbi:hypothetical protein [Streptomyces viridochromogenes]|nr:hypothetical protein [Streptomyces viridochromogenes]